MKKISLLSLSIFYILAGLNHFLNPAFYLPIIPPYLPWHHFINIFSGSIEILFGILLIPTISRKWAAYGIIAMLVAFISSHVYFIQINSCIEGGLCVSPWIGWVRLLVVHPLLIYWAWSNRK